MEIVFASGNQALQEWARELGWQNLADCVVLATHIELVPGG